MRYDENLTTERNTFVTHLECAMTGERHAADEIHNLSRRAFDALLRIVEIPSPWATFIFLTSRA